EPPAGRLVGLREGLEDLLHGRGIHPDAGVGDRDPHGRPVGFRDLDVRLYSDLAMLSELDRVADEIHHDLPYPERIADESPPFGCPMTGRRRTDIEADPLGLGGPAE